MDKPSSRPCFTYQFHLRISGVGQNTTIDMAKIVFEVYKWHKTPLQHNLRIVSSACRAAMASKYIQSRFTD